MAYMDEQDPYQRGNILEQLGQGPAQEGAAEVPGSLPTEPGAVQAFGQPAGGGIQAPVDPTTTPIEGPGMGDQPPAAQKYAMKGFDEGKLADLTHNTEKYQTGRVFQGFDPAAGITPDLLAALNKLDIGDFSGQGDRLSVKNSRNGSRFTDGTGDVIQNFSGEGPKNWTYLDTSADDPAAQAQAQGGAAGSGGAAPNTLPDMAAAAGGDGFFEKLMAQLQEQAGTDGQDPRAAIMAQLGA
jgi:hypothetical protein